MSSESPKITPGDIGSLVSKYTTLKNKKEFKNVAGRGFRTITNEMSKEKKKAYQKVFNTTITTLKSLQDNFSSGGTKYDYSVLIKLEEQLQELNYSISSDEVQNNYGHFDRKALSKNIQFTQKLLQAQKQEKYSLGLEEISMKINTLASTIPNLETESDINYMKDRLGELQEQLSEFSTSKSTLGIAFSDASKERVHIQSQLNEFEQLILKRAAELEIDVEAPPDPFIGIEREIDAIIYQLGNDPNPEEIPLLSSTLITLKSDVESILNKSDLQSPTELLKKIANAESIIDEYTDDIEIQVELNQVSDIKPLAHQSFPDVSVEISNDRKDSLFNSVNNHLNDNKESITSKYLSALSDPKAAWGPISLVPKTGSDGLSILVPQQFVKDFSRNISKRELELTYKGNTIDIDFVKMSKNDQGLADSAKIIKTFVELYGGTVEDAQQIMFLLTQTAQPDSGVLIPAIMEALKPITDDNILELMGLMVDQEAMVIDKYVINVDADDNITVSFTTSYSLEDKSMGKTMQYGTIISHQKIELVKQMDGKYKPVVNPDNFQFEIRRA